MCREISIIQCWFQDRNTAVRILNSGCKVNEFNWKSTNASMTFTIL